MHASLDGMCFFDAFDVKQQCPSQGAAVLFSGAAIFVAAFFGG